MTENILLTFLSDVKANDGKVSDRSYANVNGEPAHTTNESAARYLIERRGEISKIFILASKRIRTEFVNGFSETHLEYFENRMKKFLPGVEDFITADTKYDYEESNNNEENLKSVAEVAKMIQDYAKGRDVVLHADLTGGMRHVNILMLEIMRLLEYSGIKIDLVLYSNYNKGAVEEIQNVYNLFQLISGVEEFVNSGSVVALKKYYDKVEQSENLKNLTDAMANFAEAIKLCRYKQFKAAIEWLHDAINDFERVTRDSNNVQDMLMARLIEKIREKYELLISTRGQDDVQIIRWCIEHGYLQQALTLYTERIPEYLCENLLTQTEENRAALELKLDGEKRTSGFYLLNNYLNDSKDLEKLKNKTNPAAQTYVKHLQAYKKFNEHLDKMNETYFYIIQQYALKAAAAEGKFFNYENLQKQIFAKVTLPHGVNFPNEKELRAIFEILNKINTDKETLKLLKENLDAAEFLPIKKIIEDTPNIKSVEFGKQRRKKIFEFLKSANLREYFPPYERNSRITRLDYMVNEKIFEFNGKLDAETFFSIMEKYFILKDERNLSNHAHGIGEFKTAADLENFMNKGLDEIENR